MAKKMESDYTKKMELRRIRWILYGLLAFGGLVLRSVGWVYADEHSLDSEVLLQEFPDPEDALKELLNRCQDRKSDLLNRLNQASRKVNHSLSALDQSSHERRDQVKRSKDEFKTDILRVQKTCDEAMKRIEKMR